MDTLELNGTTGMAVTAGILGGAVATSVLNRMLRGRRDARRFAQLTAAMHDGMFIHRNGRLIDCNEAILRMTGYSRAEFEKISLVENLVTPEFRDTVLAHMHNDIETPYRIVCRRKNGETFPVELRPKISKSFRGKKRIVIVRDISKEQEAAEALRSGEARFRYLSESTVESLVFQKDGLVVDVNRAFVETFGFTREEMIGRSPVDIVVAPQDRERARERIRDRDERSYELRAFRKDGVALSIEVIPREIRLEGETVRVTALRDITMRKRVESRFARQLSLFRATFDATDEGVLVIDRNRRVESVNKRLVAMWELGEKLPEGEEEARFLEFAAAQVVDPESFAATVRTMYATPTEDSVDVVELSDGRIFERHSKPQILYGGPVGRVWSFRDITARESARRELAHQFSLNSATLESTADGVLVLDTEGRFSFANRRFGEMWNISPKRLPFENLSGFEGAPAGFSGDGPPPDPASDIIANDVVTLPDGRVYERHSRPQMLGDRVIGRVWSFHDITARVKAETALRELNAELDRRVKERTLELERSNLDLHEANTELEAFSYSVSHDLRAPLRGIDGFSLALEEEYSAKLEDSGRDYLRRVRGAVHRMGRIMDDLIHLSRVTRATMRYEAVDLAPIAREVIATLREEHPDRKVEFVCPETAPTVGDRQLLRVMLVNFLGNAWKYSSKKPEAKIVFGFGDKPGDKREFFVKDNGAGFDPAGKEKLFNTFSRLHGPQDFEGTGIGLAIVARIIRRHGGVVFADGKPGEGAVFGCVLPRRSDSFDAAPAPTVSAS